MQTAPSPDCVWLIPHVIVFINGVLFLIFQQALVEGACKGFYLSHERGVGGGGGADHARVVSSAIIMHSLAALEP